MPSTVQDFLNSRGPHRLGLCREDLPRNLAYLNPAIQRLLNVAGEDGWADGWDRVVFNVDSNNPYITAPPRYSRIISMNVCAAAIKVQNIWYETLYAGIGLRSPCGLPNGCCGALEAYARPTVSTAFDLPSSNQYLRVYITDARDIGKRMVFTNAKDQNGNGIYSQDVLNTVIGFYLVFNQPFVTSQMIVTSFQWVLKDQTYGDVILMAVDATTGVETLLARYTPDDTEPVYRRYLVPGIPNGCCVQGTPSTPAQVTAMCKVGFTAASRPTDVLAIGLIEALVEECACIRHEEMDDPTAKALAVVEHTKAVKLLNQQLDTYDGKTQPAINVAPFGTAFLQKQRIGYVW